MNLIKERAKLILQSGVSFDGVSFGKSGTFKGELVFNTSMTGYQSMLTDPSYAGQIIVLTYPLIGNYGISEVDYQSKKIHAKGIVCLENCEKPSNAMSIMTISKWLKEQNVFGISGIDTRMLTKIIRKGGLKKAIFSDEILDEKKLKNELNIFRTSFDEMKFSGAKEVEIHKAKNRKYKIAIYDLGIKRNIINCFIERNAEVKIFPYGSTPKEILEYGPDGIFFSNGPGDPENAEEAIKTMKELLGRKPIFGICLGHQILALALGLKTYKMKFGHRGANHGVLNIKRGRGYITSQNHSYAVDEKSIKGGGIKVTHRNLNDDTVEGISCKKLNAFSVQFHPEGSPGPSDSEYLFDEFLGGLK